MLGKRFLAVVLCALFFVSLPHRALAAGGASAMPVSSVSIQYAFINQASTSLTVAASGMATVYGHVQRTPAGRSIFLTSTLQRLSDGTWSNVRSWSRTSTASSATIFERHQVTRGTYRVQTYYHVAGDGGYESGTVFSQTVVY